jgi:chromate transporter
MKGTLLGQLAALFGSLSLISIGGANVLIPEIHRQVVEHYAWLDSANFARLYAISQAAPGPNIMLASIIGWHVAGLAGLLVATAAILTPAAVIALFAGRGLRHWGESHAVRVLTAALVPLALGLMLASGVVATAVASGTIAGYVVAAGVGLAVYVSKHNPLIWMGLGMIAFVLLQSV